MTARPNSGLALTIPLASIVVPEDGLRRVRATAQQDANLLSTVQALGLLVPIIVRPHPADAALWLLVDGRRRLAAAKAAELETIAAVERADLTDADATAIEAAANIQRAALAPVDQWRAIRQLQDLGWTLDMAAEALGLSQRLARRLDKLSRLHPTVLAAIEAHGMPHADYLAIMAMAPLDVQAAAMAKTPEGHEPAWHFIAHACSQRRIFRERAIFDTDLAGVVFEEDLFAEPGTPAQFATTDIEGFMEAQRAALAKRVEDSRGRLQIATVDKHGDAKLPKGWQHTGGWTFGDAKMPRGITGFVWVDANGDVRSEAARAPATERPATRVKAPLPAGHDTPPAEDTPEPDAGRGDDHDDDDDADAGEADEPPPPPAPKPRLTEAGRQLLAELRTDALRAALRDRPAPATPALALLLLALSARNLTVHGERGNKYGRTDFEDIAAATFAAFAEPDARRHREMLDHIAREAVARILICDQTKAGNGSGPAAEWIGMLVGAGAVMPRLDRADLLATLSADTLRELAQAAEIKPGKVGTMRAALTGNTPNMHLAETAFGAPLPELEPEPAPCDRAAGADRCHCGWRTSDGDTAEDCALATWQAQMRRLGLARAPEPPPAPPPEAPRACPWDGASPCPARAEDHCQHACDRRAAYDRWIVDDAARATRQQHEAQRAADATVFDAPRDPVTCGWDGETICRDEGTTVCHKLCDRHAKYATWVTTPIGKAARRRLDNAEARKRMREGRRIAP
ncbi:MULTISPECIES: ParB/RepB/Spo0J family partition protein [Roseomonadaceae]|uniref:ParB/RepB/Spo0J family partition protein n=1 Tax=Falsiroseomonas oleicola TaxID=2801474 RepID=A0ABS6H5K8_9PROT|nr:ParB/RepB/Spo0J family partition protein [Roseomonas oleicola]MBU8543967.1 ParB/RepB/Spo0J family partition protein [Roseomonas oleicola]